MYRILVTLIFISLPTFSFAIDLSDQKKSLIDRLLLQTGQSGKAAGKLMSEALVTQLVPTIRAAQPGLEPRAYSIIADEINLVVSEFYLNDKTLTKVMYEAYGPRFTEKELEAIIAFYDSDAGKKLIKETPAIMQSSMAAGRDLARSLYPILNDRIEARLQLEGIKTSP
jgi:hypothetical protein